MNVKKLIKLSKYLDDMGLSAEANYVNSLIVIAAPGYGQVGWEIPEDLVVKPSDGEVESEPNWPDGENPNEDYSFKLETSAKEKISNHPRNVAAYGLYDLYAFFLGRTPDGGYPRITSTNPPRFSSSGMDSFFNLMANDDFMLETILDVAHASALENDAAKYISPEIREVGKAQLNQILTDSMSPEEKNLQSIKKELGIPPSFDIRMEEIYTKEESDDEKRFNQTLGKYKDEIGVKTPKTAYWYPLDMEKLDEHIEVYEDILSPEDQTLIKELIGKYKNLGWAMPGQRGSGFEGLLKRPWGTYSQIDLNKIMLNNEEGYMRLMTAYYATI
ncbi:MAG: hypothetical protein CBE07_001400 [Pelagibacteraceae bacterium TMED247]|nr:MAG: hypothetical protein CBE07_001400 [Pelagibacteraceae bacterium TMED247]|tara:strand:- start:1361 stop:2350 length:990 start_codon:yes stop_codon:yes gene_type:complete